LSDRLAVTKIQRTVANEEDEPAVKTLPAGQVYPAIHRWKRLARIRIGESRALNEELISEDRR
jgi:hypothetical protein